MQQIVDFALLVDLRINIKGSEERGIYIDFVRELKKKQQLNMSLTVVPTVIGALGTIP